MLHGIRPEGLGGVLWYDHRGFKEVHYFPFIAGDAMHAETSIICMNVNNLMMQTQEAKT
jgi:hypothetical protein